MYQLVILVDTGTGTTVLGKCMWDRAKRDGLQLEDIVGKKLVGVQRTPILLHGKAHVHFELLPPPSRRSLFEIAVIVANTSITDLILGRDFLCAQQCMIEMTDNIDVLHVRAHRQSISLLPRISLNFLFVSSMWCCSNQ